MSPAKKRSSTMRAVLVNEAYLRLANHPAGTWKSVEHFSAVAAIAMRKILIDHAHCEKKAAGTATTA